MPRCRSTKNQRKRDLYLTGYRTRKKNRRWNIINGFLRRKYTRSMKKDICPPWDNEEFVRVPIPKSVSISTEKWRPELMRVIKTIHKLAGEGKSIILDFCSVTQIVASGMLLLYAEIRNIKQIFPDTIIAVFCPKNKGAGRARRDKIRQVLKQIGLFEFLGYKIDLTPSRHDVVHWKFVYDTKANGDAISKGDWESSLPNELSEVVYEGMMEAANNCVDHAYSYRQRSFSEVAHAHEGWWLFSQVKNGKVIVVFCDLGIGIPESLPLGRYKERWNWLLLRKEKWTDSEKIAEGTKMGLSATGQLYRGKGLRAIVSLAETHREAQVTIYSNAGLYKAFYGGKKEYDKDFSDSINGTIIQFDFPVKERRC